MAADLVGIRRFREPFRGSKFHALQPAVTLLKLIGDRYGKTPGQVALRWLLEQENVCRFQAQRTPIKRRIMPGRCPSL